MLAEEEELQRLRKLEVEEEERKAKVITVFFSTSQQRKLKSLYNRKNWTRRKQKRDSTVCQRC